ncbi:malonyl CoA-ACP transacylase [Mycolicibacterium boenickei]
MNIAAHVAGKPVLVKEIDDREATLRAGNRASALPRPGTSEGRQLRRWLTQLVVAEKVVADEARARSLSDVDAPAQDEVLPDTAARLQIGSIAAATLGAPLTRALFADITAAVDVSEAEIAAFHDRNPLRFATVRAGAHGWRAGPVAPALDEVHDRIAAHLRAAARRQAFRQWLDARCAALVELAPGYEHPGDPRQPDNTHKH